MSQPGVNSGTAALNSGSEGDEVDCGCASQWGVTFIVSNHAKGGRWIPCGGNGVKPVHSIKRVHHHAPVFAAILNGNQQAGLNGSCAAANSGVMEVGELNSGDNVPISATALRKARNRAIPFQEDRVANHQQGDRLVATAQLLVAESCNFV